MAKLEHLRILEKGFKIWNNWRLDNPAIQPDLDNADLRERDLSGFILAGSNLRKANLTAAFLHGSTLGKLWIGRREEVEWDARYPEFVSVPYRMIFEKDEIVEIVEFPNWKSLVSRGYPHRAGILPAANLAGACLEQASLKETWVFETDFTNCVVGGCDFLGIDLTTIKGLDTIKHKYRSTIDIDTIYKSRGEIPHIFLRGCGISESFIVNMKSILAAMSPIEFYSCFISYSSRDQDFATRLYADLQAQGVRCWFAPEDIKIGDSFRRRIDEAIRTHDKLLLVLSARSVSSPWVEKEVETAFEKERKQNRLILFPIRVDDAVIKTRRAWAADIRRTRQIGDFREWKNPKSYQTALYHLLRALKTQPRVKAASNQI